MMRQLKKTLLQLVFPLFLLTVLCFGSHLFSQEMISIEKREFEPGEDIRIHYQCSEDNLPYLWIGIFNSNVDNQMKKDAGCSIKILEKLNGSKRLNAPDTPGNYEIRLFSRQSGKVFIYRQLNIKVNASSSNNYREWEGLYLYPSYLDDSPAGLLEKYARMETVVLHYRDDLKRRFNDKFHPHVGIIENNAANPGNPFWIQVIPVPKRGFSTISVAGIDTPGSYKAYLYPNSDMGSLNDAVKSCSFTIKENYRKEGEKNYIIAISKEKLYTDESFSLDLHVQESSIPYLYVVIPGYKNYKLEDHPVPGESFYSHKKTETLNAPSIPGEYQVRLVYIPPRESKIMRNLKSFIGYPRDKAFNICDRRNITVKLREPVFNITACECYARGETIKMDFRKDEHSPPCNIGIIKSEDEIPFIFRESGFKRYKNMVTENKVRLEFTAIDEPGDYKILLYDSRLGDEGVGPTGVPVNFKIIDTPYIKASQDLYLMENENTPVQVVIEYGNLQPGGHKSLEIIDCKTNKKISYKTVKHPFITVPKGRKTFSFKTPGQYTATLTTNKYPSDCNLLEQEVIIKKTTFTIEVKPKAPVFKTKDTKKAPVFTTKCPKMDYVITPMATGRMREDDISESLNQTASKGYRLLFGALGSGTFVKEENNNTIYPVKVLRTGRGVDIEGMNQHARDHWVILNGLFLLYMFQDKDAPLYEYTNLRDLNHVSKHELTQYKNYLPGGGNVDLLNGAGSKGWELIILCGNAVCRRIKKAPVKYKYMSFIFNRDNIGKLKKLGAEGWQYCTFPIILEDRTGQVPVILKQRVGMEDSFTLEAVLEKINRPRTRSIFELSGEHFRQLEAANAERAVVLQEHGKKGWLYKGHIEFGEESADGSAELFIFQVPEGCR